ncbi:MAG: lytic transglycosylase domain-containing protein [Deltaproteobacteria bacterium]|jgi:soluble lytic murein transglycosylase-like protein|nr:lytic transglycosylase domain-containing protein [Deltaproteobacteria bacterium]MBW2532569.1 lytic transglycosylase domain-containing protein [Deltaproteobacteria bacterium]
MIVFMERGARLSVRWSARAALVAMGAAAVALLAPGHAAADIYAFTDDAGVIHFSNQRKGGGKYKLYVKSSARKRARRSPVTAVPPQDRSPGRFTRYDQWIREAATLYQIPEALVRAVIKVESDYDPRAVSIAGAQGLMQLMPETALRMRVRDSFDPRTNIFGGTRYLRILANTFNGDLQLTVAGYNAGEGAVIRHGGIPPYEETQEYVLRVLRYYHRYRTIADVHEASRSFALGS